MVGRSYPRISGGANRPQGRAFTRVAAALSKQASRDFGPIWKVAATVDAFTSLEDVPADYWPVIVQRDVEDAAGFHDDENGQPFAVVEYGPGWSVTASHEVVEMLADPFGHGFCLIEFSDAGYDAIADV